MRSIAGQWSCLTASGSSSDNSSGTAIGTTEQNTAILKTSANGLFFGGPLTNTLADICVMLTRRDVYKRQEDDIDEMADKVAKKFVEVIVNMG